MEMVWQVPSLAPNQSKRAGKACSRCQRRKKRCNHRLHSAVTSTTTLCENEPSRPAPVETEARAPVLPQMSPNTPLRSAVERQSPEPDRVGDLHPESILTDLSAASGDNRRDSRTQRVLPGDFTPEYRFSSTADGADAAMRWYRRWTYEVKRPVRTALTPALQTYLEEAGSFRILPQATRDALITTYLSQLDGLIPLVNGSRILREYSCGELSPYLTQAICLVACKTEQAAPYLRLHDRGQLLEPLEFAEKLYVGLDAAMKMDLEHNRLVKVQILALMHLHTDGPGGMQEASAHLSQAINEAWVLSLQFGTQNRTDPDQCRFMWWSLMALDRLNGCLQGTPLMISERDSDVRRPLAESDYREQVQSVVSGLGDLTETVIEMIYRPPQGRALEEFPDFAELTGPVRIERFQDSHRNYLEIWYEVLGMLSCRGALPGTAAYRRQLTCADRVHELTAHGKHISLPPLPLIPYAVGLSMTAAYRALKDSQSDTWQLAYRGFRNRCETLEALSKRWWSAKQLAWMCQSVLQNLPKIHRNRQDVGTRGVMPNRNDSLYAPPGETRRGSSLRPYATPASGALSEAPAYERPQCPSQSPSAIAQTLDAGGPREQQLRCSDLPDTANTLNLEGEHLPDLDSIFSDLWDMGVTTAFDEWHQ